MIQISSKTDLKSWVADIGGGLGFDDAEQAQIVEALRSADHPAWGRLDHALADVVEAEFDAYGTLVEELRQQAERNDAERERAAGETGEPSAAEQDAWDEAAFGYGD